MCQDYNESKSNSLIMYLDANNLYGWAMMQQLLVSGFQWVDISIDQVLTTPDGNNEGYVMEVDIEYGISNVKTWMFHNKLQMNDDKTKAILFARKGLATDLPKSIKINNTANNFVPMLQDLLATLDSSLSFNQHVMNTCRSAFFEQRRISLIRKYLTADAAKTTVCSLALSRL